MPRSIKKEILYAVLIGFVFSLFFYFLIQNLPVLGRSIPAANIIEDYMKGFFWVVLLFFLTFLIPAPNNERVSIMILWGLRSIVTLGFMLYYEYNYGLDAYAYFQNAMTNSADAFQSFDFTNGTYMVMKLSNFLLVHLPFMDSYHALKVLWSFFGFLGSYLFYRAYTNYIGESNIYFLWILQILPSIIFWSSIYGKDPLTYLGIALFFYGSMSLLNKFQLFYLVPIFLGMVVLSFVRAWLVGLFLLPFVIIYFLRSNAKPVYKYILVAGLSFALMTNLSEIIQNINIESKTDAFVALNSVSRSWSRGGSGQQVAELTSTRAVLQFLPLGMFTALFRPLPGEVNNVFGFLSGIENFALLLCVVFLFINRHPTLYKDLFFQYSLVTILIWSIFYSFISFQNLGAAVRFKLQIIPLLLLLPAHAYWLKQNRLTEK